MKENLFEELKRKAQYALNSLSRDLVYEPYGTPVLLRSVGKLIGGVDFAISL